MTEITKNDTPFDDEDDVVKSLIDLGNEMRSEQKSKHEKKLKENPVYASQVIDGLSVIKELRSYCVVVPVPSGVAHITFSEISRSRQSFDTLLNIQLTHAEEGKLPAFEQRIDLNSASAVSNLATSLNSAYGNKKEGYNWVLIMNKAGNAVKKLLTSEKKPQSINNQEYREDVFLLSPFLEQGTATMIFGDGSTGKTYFALSMMATAHLERPFFGYPTKRMRALFIDYEDSFNGFVNRMHYIAGGLGVTLEDIQESVDYYKPDGSMRDESEIVANMVAEGGYDVIIIDAGADASGGSPMDEKSVLDLFNALNRIECTKLIIHHEPKRTEGIDAEKAYYGTTYWRNRVRIAWRLCVESKETNTRKVIKAAMTKANNMATVEPFNYIMEFHNQERKIDFTPIDQWAKSDEVKVFDVLADGAADEGTIIDGSGLSRTQAQRVINDLMEKGKIERKRDGRKYVYYVPTTNYEDNF